jgi:hypothetical protein
MGKGSQEAQEVRSTDLRSLQVCGSWSFPNGRTADFEEHEVRAARHSCLRGPGVRNEALRAQGVKASDREDRTSAVGQPPAGGRL